MAVLMIAEVPDLTEEIYAAIVAQLKQPMLSAQGFIAHAGGPSPEGGWRVVEMWESEQDAENWFNEVVKPNLPAGIVPNRTYRAVHTAFAR